MVIKVTMGILCDTVCVWALYFRDSAYRRHVLDLRAKYGLVIPNACLLEAAYPIYRAKGLQELANYSAFVRNIILAKGVETLEMSQDDLAAALRMAVEDPETFVDEEGNLCLFDALIASIWLRTRMSLATTDFRLINFGKKKGLNYIELKREKKYKLG